jgi:hypothetical protein
MTVQGMAPSSTPHTPSPSRGAFRPGLANRFAQTRGRGECRVLAAPAVSCARVEIEAHTSIQVQPEHSGIPRAMVLRLMARSPWRRIRLASIAGELTVCIARLGFANLRRLDASHGRQNHTLLPYASAPFVCRAADRSQAKARPAIPPAQRALPRPPHSDPRP